jgi:hypothetical protein
MIGGSREERLVRQTVQALLHRSHYAAAAFALVGLGALLQLAAPSPSPALLSNILPLHAQHAPAGSSPARRGRW